MVVILGLTVREIVFLPVSTFPAGYDAVSRLMVCPRLRGFIPSSRIFSGWITICTSFSSYPDNTTRSTLSSLSMAFSSLSENLINEGISSFVESANVQIGWSSKSNALTAGVVASSGKLFILLTAVWISCSAFLGSVPEVNWMVIIDAFSLDEEVSVSIFATELMPSSMGMVTSDSISCGDAPGSIVEMDTIGMFICGFKRCGMLK